MTCAASLRSHHAVPAIEKIALFTDFDGTLVDIAPISGACTVPASTMALLEDLKRKTDGALAIVTGRRISNLDQMIAPLHVAASGCLGAEIRMKPDDEIEILSEALPREVVQQLQHIADEMPNGVVFEDKIYNACLHYDDLADIRGLVEKKLELLLSTLPADLDLIFTPKSCEIKRRSMNKGHAVSRFLASPDFRDKLPVYIGDGVLDREAFTRVRVMGGIAIGVGEPAFPEVNFTLKSVQAAHQWLGMI